MFFSLFKHQVSVSQLLSIKAQVNSNKLHCRHVAFNQVIISGSSFCLNLRCIITGTLWQAIISASVKANGLLVPILPLYLNCFSEGPERPTYSLNPRAGGMWNKGNDGSGHPRSCGQFSDRACLVQAWIPMVDWRSLFLGHKCFLSRECNKQPLCFSGVIHVCSHLE